MNFFSNGEFIEFILIFFHTICRTFNIAFSTDKLKLFLLFSSITLHTNIFGPILPCSSALKNILKYILHLSEETHGQTLADLISDSLFALSGQFSLKLLLLLLKEYGIGK